jgi:hypothetical protein
VEKLRRAAGPLSSVALWLGVIFSLVVVRRERCHLTLSICDCVPSAALERGCEPRDGAEICERWDPRERRARDWEIPDHRRGITCDGSVMAVFADFRQCDGVMARITGFRCDCSG